jgi:hypothetical protein
MTANRRDEPTTLTVNGVVIDEVSEIRYEEVYKRLGSMPRRKAAPTTYEATFEMPAGDWDRFVRAVERNTEPPGLARNRRARERWVRMDESNRAERHAERMLGYWAPANADAPEGYWSA